ncbi:Uncharacterised protein [Moraxella lacunata]|uniref:Uncharacterized protein n=1 Tax=Moraxella lacunata TaxID=477 RepID=A0A378UC13_MORLA|nr:Uncharacterised protein [Moraxella lacunata]
MCQNTVRRPLYVEFNTAAGGVFVGKAKERVTALPYPCKPSSQAVFWLKNNEIVLLCIIVLYHDTIQYNNTKQYNLIPYHGVHHDYHS